MGRHYKELMGHTGSAVFDDQLTVFAPNASEEMDFASFVKERDWAWVHLREGDVPLPERFFTGGRRLMAFAAIEGTYFYRDVRDGVAPQAWGVVIVDRELDNWYEFELSATQCIYQVLVGNIQLPPFEGCFGGPEHDVGRFGT